MFRPLTKSILVLFLACTCVGGQDAARSNLPQSLAAAADLYNNARFEAASRLLLQIEGQSSSVGSEDLKKLRLYQALVGVALNDSENAKKRFLELLTLEPSFALNREEYAPKVIGIFDDARTEFL